MMNSTSYYLQNAATAMLINNPWVSYCTVHNNFAISQIHVCESTPTVADKKKFPFRLRLRLNATLAFPFCKRFADV